MNLTRKKKHEKVQFFGCTFFPNVILIAFVQSQGMRLIEASLDQFNFTGAQRSIYQKVDQCVGEKEKGEPDFGIPWTTHDAFALLLQVIYHSDFRRLKVGGRGVISKCLEMGTEI